MPASAAGFFAAGFFSRAGLEESVRNGSKPRSRSAITAPSVTPSAASRPRKIPILRSAPGTGWAKIRHTISAVASAPRPGGDVPARQPAQVEPAAGRGEQCQRDARDPCGGDQEAVDVGERIPARGVVVEVRRREARSAPRRCPGCPACRYVGHVDTEGVPGQEQEDDQGERRPLRRRSHPGEVSRSPMRPPSAHVAIGAG